MKKIIISFILLVLVCGCKDLSLDLSSPVQEDEEKVFVAGDEELIAHFLDVGQGDANIIELPNGEIMLIDAGIASYEDDIINYIEELGYEKIDYVVATHPHADHIGGMAEVIDAFSVGKIYMPKAVSTSKTYENLLMTIQNKGLSIKSGKAGVQILKTDDLEIAIVAPHKDYYSNLNNYSIVLKITYGDVSFLYTGDAEEESIEEITENIQADILKVGHHGSDTSTTKAFLDKVQPKYAVISVGNENSYGHPANSTIKLLEEYTLNIYRTDFNGTIIISTDGINVDVKVEKE